MVFVCFDSTGMGNSFEKPIFTFSTPPSPDLKAKALPTSLWWFHCYASYGETSGFLVLSLFPHMQFDIWNCQYGKVNETLHDLRLRLPPPLAEICIPSDLTDLELFEKYCLPIDDRWDDVPNQHIWWWWWCRKKFTINLWWFEKYCWLSTYKNVLQDFTSWP